MVTVKIKKLNPKAILPKKANPSDAAFDIAIPEDYRLTNGRHIIRLGFAMELPEGYCAKIRPRSGLSSKGMEVVMNVSARIAEPARINADVLDGLIDSSYRGEVGVIVKSASFKPAWLMAGSRIAQMTIEEVTPCVMELVDKLNAGERGTNGFGSTGIKTESK